MSTTARPAAPVTHPPDGRGRFGRFGGRFVPETVMAALDELEAAVRRRCLTLRLMRSATASRTITSAGRRHLPRRAPDRATSVARASFSSARISPTRGRTRSTTRRAGADRREARQAPHRRRDGRRAAWCRDRDRVRALRNGVHRLHGRGGHPPPAPNVVRMGLLGAEVRAVEAGTATLKDAMNEAIRDWIANVEDTHY